MYPEFIIIYVALAVMFLLIIACLIMLIVLLKRTAGNTAPKYHAPYVQPTPNPASTVANQSVSQTSAGSGLVFCKKCAAELQPGDKRCPVCGTPR